MARSTPHRTLPSGRGSAVALVSILLLSLAPLMVARAAAGQVAEAWVHATPIEALGIWQSARLTAMGGLTVSAEDRFSRLNAYEYGMNPAGLLGLRDTSWAEQGSEYQDFADDLAEAGGNAPLVQVAKDGEDGAETVHLEIGEHVARCRRD